MDRAVSPLLTLPIPWTVVVVASPIHIERETHDGYAKSRRIRIQRNVAALIRVGDVGRVEPPPIISKGDITPTPIIETAHHLDGCVGIELRHLGIRGVGTRADACVIGGLRVLRHQGAGNGQKKRANRKAQAS
jgi:hypothetical protein